MPTTRHLTGAGVSRLCQWRAIPARAEPDARAPAFQPARTLSACARQVCENTLPFPRAGTGPAIRLNIPAGLRTLRKRRRSASRSERLSPGLRRTAASTAPKIRVQTFPLSAGCLDFCNRTLCRSAAKSRRYEKREPHTRFPFSIRRDGQKPVGAFFSTCRPCRHPCRAQQEPQAQAWAVQQWRIRWSAGERPRKRHAAERSGKPA